MHILDKNSISIIGGAGHVGFPLGLAFALKKYDVKLVDINSENLLKIKKGKIPFKEKNAGKILKQCLKNKKIEFRGNLKNISESKYIIICIGTPINDKLKPNINYFLNFFYKLKKNLNKKHVVIIRSSIYPGLIKRVEKILSNKNQNIVYCPERIVQGLSLEELPKLPQIIAGNNISAVKDTKKIFKRITGKIIETNILEAELIKLFSNANRYINFSIANQLYMICDENNLNFSKIRNIMREGYERNLNLPNAGFTGGPCLLKDTMQLSSFYKKDFILGTGAMKINEGIPNLIIKKIKSIKRFKSKIVGVLGLSFKAETDDIRDSLSIKLLKKLKKNKIKYLQSDEYYQNKKNIPLKKLVKKSNIIVIGAPHKNYKKIKFNNKILIDVWGHIKK